MDTKREEVGVRDIKDIARKMSRANRKQDERVDNTVVKDNKQENLAVDNTDVRSGHKKIFQRKNTGKESLENI